MARMRYFDRLGGQFGSRAVGRQQDAAAIQNAFLGVIDRPLQLCASR